MRAPGHPQLITRRGQAKFKVKDHGAIHGVEYYVNKKGGTVSERTEENTDILMDSIQKTVSDSESIWFEKGTY